MELRNAILFLILLIFLAFLYFGLDFMPNVSFTPILGIWLPPTTPDPSEVDGNKPIILAWTPFFSGSLSESLRTNAERCPFKCHYTSNRRRAAAIVFHGREISSSDLPPARQPSQLFMLYLLEAPPNTWGLGDLPPDYFNATMTYRRDSDYFSPYDGLSPITNASKPSEIYTAREVHIVSWAKCLSVSNCKTQSKRERYASELRKHIAVTQIGYCSSQKCSRNTACEDALIREHFFYLAFENSVCNDYVTEKFWRMKRLIFPVVLKRSIAEPLVPANSFIAADDFASPKDLASHLKALVSNATAYRQYYEWTKSFSKIDSHSPVCDLCRDLHLESSRSRQVKDFNAFWFANQCFANFGTTILHSN